MERRAQKTVRKNGMEILRNGGITAVILGIATAVCFILQNFAITDTHVPLLFVLAVLFISRFTDGYLYGIAASMLAVVFVNFVFTYPYFALNFSITGYPVTFLVMLAVAVSISTLTTQIKRQEQVHLEVEKEKMRANLLRAVSHDIRTPLTSILGSATGILDNYDVLGRDEEKELIRDMKKEAQWLIRMVENLLSITRFRGDGARIHTVEEVVEEVIGGAVEKFKKQFPDVKIDVEMPQDVLLVPMDGILIEQVLVNLMENSAVHGGNTQSIRIVVSDMDDRVLLSVEDDGQGIRQCVLPVIFEGKIHTMAEGETSDAKRNMGIGLSVCMSIVKAHNGSMKAENMSGRGARVLFWLPKKAGE